MRHIRTVPCCRARWLREIGFVGREYKRWYHQKPRCTDNSQGFASVAIQDFYPALVVLAYGILFSLVILMVELAYNKTQRRCSKARPEVHHAVRSHQNITALQKSNKGVRAKTIIWLSNGPLSTRKQCAGMTENVRRHTHTHTHF